MTNAPVSQTLIYSQYNPNNKQNRPVCLQGMQTDDVVRPHGNLRALAAGEGQQNHTAPQRCPLIRLPYHMTQRSAQGRMRGCGASHHRILCDTAHGTPSESLISVTGKRGGPQDYTFRAKGSHLKGRVGEWLQLVAVLAGQDTKITPGQLLFPGSNCLENLEPSI